MAFPDFPFPRSLRPASGFDSMPGGFTGQPRDFPSPQERGGGAGAGWAGVALTLCGNPGGAAEKAGETDKDSDKRVLGGMIGSERKSAEGGVGLEAEALAESPGGSRDALILPDENPALSAEAAFSLQQLSAALMQPAGGGAAGGPGLGKSDFELTDDSPAARAAAGDRAMADAARGGGVSLAALADQLSVRFTQGDPAEQEADAADLLSDSGPVPAPLPLPLPLPVPHVTSRHLSSLTSAPPSPPAFPPVSGPAATPAATPAAIPTSHAASPPASLPSASPAAAPPNPTVAANPASTPAAIRAAAGALSQSPGRASAMRQGDVFFLGGDPATPETAEPPASTAPTLPTAPTAPAAPTAPTAPTAPAAPTPLPWSIRDLTHPRAEAARPLENADHSDLLPTDSDTEPPPLDLLDAPDFHALDSYKHQDPAGQATLGAMAPQNREADRESAQGAAHESALDAARDRAAGSPPELPPHPPTVEKSGPPPLLPHPAAPAFLRRADSAPTGDLSAFKPSSLSTEVGSGSHSGSHSGSGTHSGSTSDHDGGSRSGVMDVDGHPHPTDEEYPSFLSGLGASPTGTGAGSVFGSNSGSDSESDPTPATGGGLGLVLGGAGLVLLGIGLACRLPLIWLDLQGAGDWSARKGMAALLLHGVPALAALGLGAGSLFSRRWAPPLIHAAGWLAVFSGALLTGIAGFSLGSESETTLTVLDGWLLAAGLLLPLAYLLYYERADTAAICQASDPAPSWTDRLSTPALMVLWCGLALATGAGAMLFLQPAFPLPPDQVLTGSAAQGVWAGLAVAGGLTALCAALRSAAANWILLAAALGLAVCLGHAAFSGGTLWHEFSTALGRPQDAGPPLPLISQAAGLATLPVLLALAMARRAFASPPPP